MVSMGFLLSGAEGAFPQAAQESPSPKSNGRRQFFPAVVRLLLLMLPFAEKITGSCGRADARSGPDPRCGP